MYRAVTKVTKVKRIGPYKAITYKVLSYTAPAGCYLGGDITESYLGWKGLPQLGEIVGLKLQFGYNFMFAVQGHLRLLKGEENDDKLKLV